MNYLTKTNALLITIVALMLCSVTSVQAGDQDSVTTLTFGIIPTDSLANLRESFEPFARALDKKMGPNYRIETKYASDYAGIIEGMRFDKVDFAWYGNKSAMEAVDNAGAEIFAQTVGANGAPGYWSHIIVPDDSPYESIDQIIKNGEKLVFGNGDPNSTSGFLVPGYYIWGKRGLNPNELFKEVRNASHEANCLAVAKGQIDFATNNNESIERFKQNFPNLANEIRIIWKSPLIPSDPLAWRKDLPRDDKAALKAAILGFGRFGSHVEREKEILDNVQNGWAPFYNSTNRQLLPIRQLDLAKTKMKVSANDDLSTGQKRKRLKTIGRKLKGLSKYVELIKQFN